MSLQPDLKRFSTVQALAALHGVTLHQLEGDGSQPIFIATRWAMTKQLDHLDDVEAWLQMVTGKTMEHVTA